MMEPSVQSILQEWSIPAWFTSYSLSWAVLSSLVLCVLCVVLCRLSLQLQLPTYLVQFSSGVTSTICTTSATSIISTAITISIVSIISAMNTNTLRVFYRVVSSCKQRYIIKLQQQLATNQCSAEICMLVLLPVSPKPPKPRDIAEWKLSEVWKRLLVLTTHVQICLINCVIGHNLSCLWNI